MMAAVIIAMAILVVGGLALLVEPGHWFDAERGIWRWLGLGDSDD